MRRFVMACRIVIAAMVAGFFASDVSLCNAQLLPPVENNSVEAAIVDSSATVLQEIMAIPARGIPTSMLQSAEGLVIVPGLLKGGFIIGAKHGRGVVVVRDPNTGWQLPQFITVNGGSIGWQAGVQATDLVLVFRTKKSIQGLLSGKFTIGADASAAAGPVGREASAATDMKLQAEIYSYSRSRGLFAGVSIDGSKLSMDSAATDVYYRSQVALAPGQAAPLPASALRLMQEVNRYAPQAVVAAPGMIVPAGAAPAVLPAPQQVADLLAVRQKLITASQRLNGLVDEQWRNYLTLPPEIYAGNREPTAEAMAQAAARFQAVAANPQYATLSSRPEFVETSQLLQQIITLMPQPAAINLPPPPAQ